jgi:hypothetical protein
MNRARVILAGGPVGAPAGIHRRTLLSLFSYFPSLPVGELGQWGTDGGRGGESTEVQERECRGKEEEVIYTPDRPPYQTRTLLPSAHQQTPIRPFYQQAAHPKGMKFRASLANNPNANRIARRIVRRTETENGTERGPNIGAKPTLTAPAPNTLTKPRQNRYYRPFGRWWGGVGTSRKPVLTLFGSCAK